MVPLTVHTLLVSELKITGFPEPPPVAETAPVPPIAIDGAAPNTMVCVDSVLNMAVIVTLALIPTWQVPVFVHPVDSPCIDVLGFGRPSSIIEFPIDTARNITNGLYTGLFQRHPNLKLILAHCGGALPTLAWRIGEHTAMGRGPHDADIDATHVAEVLRGLYYETSLAGSRNSLLPTLEVTTADHILFGTDWPAAPEVTGVHNIDNLTSFDGFTPDELRGVERDNALRLFPRFD